MPPKDYPTSYGYYSRRRRSRRLVRLAFFIVVFSILIVIVPSLLKIGIRKVELPKFTSHFSFNFPREDNELDKIVTQNLKTGEGDFAIYIESLADTKGYTLKASEQFPSASLYKLFLMAAVMKEVEGGNLKLDDNVSASRAHIEEVLGGEEFGYEGAPSTIGYTVEQALDRVGRISDNYAAIILAEKITWDKVQEMANEIGAKHTIIKTPIQTSASDIGLFFQKLYLDQIVSPSSSQRIKDILTIKLSGNPQDERLYGEISQSPFTNRIAAKLPTSVKIAHKTGELARVRHDAGIVLVEGKPYVIVLMSQNLKDENEGIETLANVSEAIYKYFNGKKD